MNRRLGRRRSGCGGRKGRGSGRNHADVCGAEVARYWAGIPDSATVEQLPGFGVAELGDPNISVVFCEESAISWITIITVEEVGGIIFTTESTCLGTVVAHYLFGSTEKSTTFFVDVDVPTGSRLIFVKELKVFIVDANREGLSREECKHYGEDFS